MFIDRETISLLKEKKHLVVALSGGVDSVVVLNLLKQVVCDEQEMSLRAVYINHNLSSNASYWEEFCAATCDELNVDFKAISVSFNKRKNIEANARNARYEAFLQDLQEDEYLVTGHHLDDQVETLFLALNRGAGLDGLSCMAINGTVNSVKVIRPLLNTDKDAIIEYAMERNIDWIEDESNSDNHYDRNFIRNEVLPLLKKRWPSFSKTATRSIKMCQVAKENATFLAKAEVDQFMKAGYVSKQYLLKLPSHHRYFLLREWLKRNDVPPPSLAQMKNIERTIIESRDFTRPYVELTNDVTLRRVSNVIFLNKANKEDIFMDLYKGNTND